MADQLNIGIRFALYANLMLLFGLPLFAIYALKSAQRVNSNILPLRTLTCWLSASGFALSMLGIVAMTASMMGVALLEVDFAAITVMIFETPMGVAWLVRVVALIAALAVAFRMNPSNGSPKLCFAALASGAALGSLAWTGHGAAGEDTTGTLQLIADVAHLLGAGAWLGALAALTIIVFRDAETLDEENLNIALRLLKNFSVAGTIIVAVVLGSGLVNGWVLVGPLHVLSIHTTLYGRLLIAKLLLFGIMLLLAAVNRYKLTPGFERALQSGGTLSAVMKLRHSLVLELGIAVCILGLVAWLGTLEPPR
jgi:copper resistance protein D